MTSFIIKSGVCMVLFFGVYWLLLRREKLFVFTRYFLLLSLLISIAIPFTPVTVTVGYFRVAGGKAANQHNIISPALPENSQSPSYQNITSLNKSANSTQMQTTGPQKGNFYVIKALLIIYLSGFLLMLFRFCRNLQHIGRLYRKSEILNRGNYKIALLNDPVNPFTFMRTVYFNRHDYKGCRISENVLHHELEHVRQWHSVDVLFLEFINIIFWFNPVLLLYRSAVKTNHEYLADEAVMYRVQNLNIYATELISFSGQRAAVPIACGFSPSMIRLRLMMLNTKTTSRVRIKKVLITLTFSVLLLGLLGIRPVYSEYQEIKSEQGSKSLNKDQDIVTEEVHFRNPDFSQQKAIVVIDGRKIGSDEMVSIDPRQIKTIGILNGRKAIRKFGRSAKDGVVEITTYKADSRSFPDTAAFKTNFTVNNKVPESSINITVSNLFSWSIWKYPIFPNQDLRKRWRTIDIMTRDYYRIGGRVIQKDGQPLQGVLLTATDNPSHAITDKDGRFILEDVKPDVIASLMYKGYKPFYFKVNDAVFNYDLVITLESDIESDVARISVDFSVKDFSGRWIINKDSTLKMNPGFSMEAETYPNTFYTYDIRQYDSDSILMVISGNFEEGKKLKEFKEHKKFFFNTVKTEKSAFIDNIKSVVTCTVGSGGESFSVANRIQSTLGLFKEYTMTDTYTLSKDAKHMIIRQYFPGNSDLNNINSMALVFDKM